MKVKLEEIFDEAGHGLSWVEFEEKGCPAKKEDYFLTNKEILKAVIPLLKMLKDGNRFEEYDLENFIYDLEKVLNK